MTVKFEDLTGADVAPAQGEKIFLDTTNDRHYAGEFIGQNETGVGILDEGQRYRFFPWTNIVSLWKEIER